MRKFLFGLIPLAIVFGSSNVSVITSQPNKIELRTDFRSIATSEITVKGRIFSRVNIYESGVSTEIGLPELPIIREFIEIPQGAVISVGVTVLKETTLTLNYPLYPKQPPIPKTGPKPEFTIDEKFYVQDLWFPEARARIAEIVEIRGHRLAVLEICPVRYNPKQNLIEFNQQQTIRLNLSGSNLAKTIAYLRRYYSKPFESMLSGIIKNYGAFAIDPPPDLPVGMLIITPNEWEANIQPLAQWRKKKGYEVFVRNLSQVGGGSAEVVRNYILDAYNNWPIPPTFVLLIGDVDRIGYFNGQGQGSPHTDLNFALMTTPDYLPDIYVSRYSVANSYQLDSLVLKTIKYEKNQWLSGTEWTKKGYFIASSDGGNHQVAEGTHRYCMAVARRYGMICDSIWLYYGTGTPITTAINDGRSWVMYSGHGYYQEWSDPDFTNDDVRLLTNIDKVPFVGTFACLSGDYANSSYPECFSEAWIRVGFRGAIAHMASSVTSYWTEDDTLQRRLYDCGFDSSLYWVMGMVNKAKIIFYQQMGPSSTTRRYLEMYNVMGDGAIDVYSDIPHNIQVSHPAVVSIGTIPVTITVNDGGTPVPNALVCALGRTDTMVHEVGYTNAAGQVTLTLTTTMPDTISITVTGHNLAPYLGHLLVLPASGPYVVYLRHSIIDTAPGGNGDGIVNPGENVTMPVWVKNWGSATANNLRTWLRTTDPNIVITDSFKSYGNILAGDSGYVADGFKFSVALACTNGYILRFTLTCVDAQDSSWTSFISVPVGAPILNYVGNFVNDSGQYRPNGRLDPGETGQMIVSLCNRGLGNAYNVSAVLRSGDARLTIVDSIGSFGTILADSVGNNNQDRFVVTASWSIPPETNIPCTLHITAANGYSAVSSFTIMVGGITATDPIPDGPRQPPLYYGYDDVDSFYPQHPTYEWVEINTIGTRLTLSDDQTVQITLPTGFGPWKFYNQRYTELSICSNGWIAPGYQTANAYSNRRIPDSNTSNPNGMVCANWDDLLPNNSGVGGVYYYHDAANHRFIIEYDSVPYFGATSIMDKFEIVIYDTTLAPEDGNNEIVVNYMAANRWNSSTVGIEDPTNQIAICALFNDTLHRGCAPFVPGKAIKYTTRQWYGIEDITKIVAINPSFSIQPIPFRNELKIRYQISGRGEVKLRIYDATGKMIYSLLNHCAKLGTYSFNWDGRDNLGRKVASGIYFFELEIPSVKYRKKLVRLE
ncbi:MAG: C25 family cysteine peptidase [candidate division WOR-3 bacterium]